MSSSNMMYNYWKYKKKTINLARNRTPRTPVANDSNPDPYWSLEVGNNSHDFISPSHIGEAHNLREPGRMMSKTNNAFATLSPLSFHNEQAEDAQNHDWNNRHTTLTFKHQLQNRFNDIINDYPEFPTENPLILHFRGDRDTLPNTLPGETYVLPKRNPYEERALTPEEDNHLKDWIMRQAANKWADILTGQTPGRTGYTPHIRIDPAALARNHREYADILHNIHREYAALPEGDRPRDLTEYIEHRLPLTNDNPFLQYKLGNILEMLRAHTAPPTPSPPAFNPEYFRPPDQESFGGEDVSLDDLKGLLGDIGDVGKPKFNSEGGFSLE